ncbi:hypothetical protein [Ralstonia pseudosolanacearum]|uniref:hypothetical protein n=1 Tax=Ralstonia pseudosolanacearum TaxID=1310165 RepID=UPI003CF25B5F
MIVSKLPALVALSSYLEATHPGVLLTDIRPTSTRGLWIVKKHCGGVAGGCKSPVHERLPDGNSCLRQVEFFDVPGQSGVQSRYESWREHRRQLGMNPARIFRAKLKSRKEMERDIPREALGWWHDVCPGEVLYLREATLTDVGRCSLRKGTSREPADYFCELGEDGSLVSRLAVKRLEEVPLEVAL